MCIYIFLPDFTGLTYDVYRIVYYKSKIKQTDGSVYLVKRIITIMLVIGLLSSLMMTTIYGISDDDIEVEYTIGYDESVKIGDGNPLEMTIENNGEDFSGEVQVMVTKPNQNTIIYAKKFDIASQSTKTIEMTIPFMTIQRKVEVKVVSGRKTLYEDTYKVGAIYPPDASMVAVIADDADDYRFFSNLEYLRNFNSEYIDYYPMYSGVTKSTSEYEVDSVKPNAVFIEDMSTILTQERMAFFNHIFIGEIDQLEMSEDEQAVLTNWIEGGGILMSESGNIYEKMNQVLPEVAKIVEFDQKTSVNIDDIYIGSPVNESVMVASASNIGDDVQELIVMEQYLGYQKRVGRGYILQLAVDFGTAPLSSWNGKVFMLTDFVENLNANDINGDVYYDDNLYMYNNFLNNIPVTKTAPYIIMIVVLVLYILSTGPILYFIMKKKDKRIHIWWLVPAVSVFSVCLFFVLGFGTRYTKPIVNQLSKITYAHGDGVAGVDTYMNVLNNKRGDLSISWSSTDDELIEFMNNQDNYYYYQQGNPGDITGKMIQGATTEYLIYDTSVWQGNMMKASMNMTFDADEMIKASFDEDSFTVTIDNVLPFALKGVFVNWEDHYLDIGNLEPGETKVIEKSLTASKFDGYWAFDEKRYGYISYNDSQKVGEELKDNYALREMLRNMYDYGYYNEPYTIMDNTVKLVGISYDTVEYNVDVNGGNFDAYNTNIVEIVSTMTYEPGTNLSLDETMIFPQGVFGYDESFTRTGYLDYNNYEHYFWLYESGIVDLTYTLPTAIDLEQLSVDINKPITQEQLYSGSAQTSNTLVVPSYIYNYETERFDEIDPDVLFETTDSAYLLDGRQVLIRVDVRASLGNGGNGGKYMDNILQLPEFEVKGVVR